MKTTKITIEHTELINSVCSVWSDEEANKLLAKGWILMHAGVAHKGVDGYQAKPVYVLAKK